jgi:probable DNA metabolism protein
MLNYIFDGSFEGLLTAIYEAYYRHEDPQRILATENPQIDFFEQNYKVITNSAKAKKVYNAIKEKISPKALKDIYYIYLCDSEEDRGIIVHNYLKVGWKHGNKLDQHLCNNHVFKVQSLCKTVTFECHRLLGLIRFKKLEDDLYYAQIEPDSNIIGLLAPHFSKRLADQNWVIHDVKRNIAAMFNKSEWVLSSINTPPKRIQDDSEVIYQNLWKQYFKNIAIKSRINPKLQKRCMPVRYWGHLIEKE